MVLSGRELRSQELQGKTPTRQDWPSHNNQIVVTAENRFDFFPSILVEPLTEFAWKSLIEIRLWDLSMYITWTNFNDFAFVVPG